MLSPSPFSFTQGHIVKSGKRFYNIVSLTDETSRLGQLDRRHLSQHLLLVFDLIHDYLSIANTQFISPSALNAVFCKNTSTNTYCFSKLHFAIYSRFQVSGSRADNDLL